MRPKSPRRVAAGVLSKRQRSPEVSVIVPDYNMGHWLPQAVDSVLAQSFQDLEVIIVDDGSTDNTSEVAASYKDPRVRYIYQPNQGLPAARNTGIRIARGEFIALLDTDDLWLPEKLAKQIALFDSSPSTVGLVYSDYYIFDDQTGANSGQLSHVRTLHRGKVFAKLLRPGASFIRPSSVLILREVFERLGLFDESLKGAEDWEMWVRMAAVYEVEAVDEPLLRCRDHDNNMRKDGYHMYRYGKLARLKVMAGYPLGQSERRALLQTLARVHYLYALWLLKLGNRREGGRAFLTALRLHPTALSRCPHAALASLSPGLYKRLEAAKRWLARQKWALAQPR